MGKDFVMTENIENENDASDNTPSELDLLKERATMMGVKFSSQIGAEKLKLKIQEHQTKPVKPVSLEQADGILNGIDVEAESEGAKVTETNGQRRVRLRKDASQLVRCRITNMNPIKGSLKGEILSVGNAAIGSIKKFIPYNAENGWHVPQLLLTQLKNRKYMSHFEIKVKGQRIKKHKLIPEFAIETLPPLTAKELQDLARQQAINAGEL